VTPANALTLIPAKLSPAPLAETKCNYLTIKSSNSTSGVLVDANRGRTQSRRIQRSGHDRPAQIGIKLLL
jgi:hypothetical protein